MSYILEAIKKADQKRKLGSVPDVHTIHEMPPAAARRLFWPYIVAVGLFVNASLITWWLHPWETPVVEKTVSTVVPIKKPIAGVSVPPPPVRKMTKQDSAVAAPSPVVTRPKVVSLSSDKAPIAQRGAGKTAVRTARRPKGPAAKTANPSVGDEAARITGIEHSAPAPSIPAADKVVKVMPHPTMPSLAVKGRAIHPTAMERIGGTPLPAFGKDDQLVEQQRRQEAAALSKIPFLRQLPAEVRDRIPEISISYHAYFFNASRRMVSIDGKIFREGNIIDGDLRLVRITPSGVVLQYKNWQFRVNV